MQPNRKRKSANQSRQAVGKGRPVSLKSLEVPRKKPKQTDSLASSVRQNSNTSKKPGQHAMKSKSSHYNRFDYAQPPFKFEIKCCGKNRVKNWVVWPGPKYSSWKLASIQTPKSQYVEFIGKSLEFMNPLTVSPMMGELFQSKDKIKRTC